MDASDIRGLLSQIEHLTPQLNDATNEAGQAVRQIESFLEKCGVGLFFCLVVMENEDDEAIHLLYQRVRDRFRIAVRVQNMPAAAIRDNTLVPWAECPRNIKMLTFPYVPELLKVIVGGLAAEIEKTTSTSQLAGEMMAAVQPGPIDLRRASAVLLETETSRYLCPPLSGDGDS
ncbi:MAG: hypothetical protein ACYSWT_05560 [Planctomycetota bacterium]|jgi:hypothetical protein